MKKKHVLIVDDEPTNINIVAEILHPYYDIRVATSGKDALEMITSEKPDLILLDINMPEMSGYEVANELKNSKKNSNIPFIFLTAKNDSKSIEKGFNNGAVDYISKPFSKEELQARVATHLKIFELNNSLEETVNTLEIKMQEIDQRKKEFETIFDKSLNGIAITNLDTKFITVNNSFCEILGLEKDELKDSYFSSLEEIDENIESQKIVNLVIKNGYIENINRNFKINNKIISINISISLMPDRKTLLYNIADITKLKQAQIKIEHYIEIMDENIIYSTTDLKGIIKEASNAFCETSGYKKEELISFRHSIVRHEDTPNEVFDDLWNTIEKGNVWKGEMKNKKKDGSDYWVEATIYPNYDIITGKKTGYTSIRQNITDKKRIEEISIHDELTKLYNRRHFNSVLSNELNRAKRDNRTLSFMMIDVDHFKLYNDTYGHQEGDRVLFAIAKILQSFCKRAGDFAFRLGGEEFGILFSEQTEEESEPFANLIRESIQNLQIPHIQNLPSKVVTISAGLLMISPKQTITEDDIYKNADILLYKAKESGRNKVSV